MPIDISSLTEEERAELLEALLNDSSDDGATEPTDEPAGEPQDPTDGPTDEPQEPTDDPTDEPQEPTDGQQDAPRTLKDDVRVALRVISTATDVEIEGYVDAAIADMRRFGVRDELLVEPLNPLARNAVVMFCKASYGFDSKDYDRFWERYIWTCTALKNSDADECIYEELHANDEPDGDSDETDDGSGEEPGDDSEGGGEPDGETP